MTRINDVNEKHSVRLFCACRSKKALLAVAAEVADDPPAPVVVSQRRVCHSINHGRRQYGEYHQLCQELRLDEDRFKVYFRFNRQQFEGVLTFIGPTIAKMNTNYRESISPAQRLCICLR